MFPCELGSKCRDRRSHSFLGSLKLTTQVLMPPEITHTSQPHFGSQPVPGAGQANETSSIRLVAPTEQRFRESLTLLGEPLLGRLDSVSWGLEPCESRKPLVRPLDSRHLSRSNRARQFLRKRMERTATASHRLRNGVDARGRRIQPRLPSSEVKC